MFTLRGLTIDNGGSEVRTLAIGSNNEVVTMTNDFVRIDEKNFRVKDTDDKYELCRITQAPKEEYKGIVSRGMTGKLYDSEDMSIDNHSTKTGSINYYRQFIYAIARDAISALRKREEMLQEKRKEQVFGMPVVKPLPVDGYDYVIGTCIPIKEHSGRNDCAAKLKAALAGEYTVEFPLLEGTNKVSFNINPSYIGVVPEGGVAITALRKEVKEDDLTIIVDMGHVSTDLALFKGRTLYGGKVISSPYAGSTLIANTRAALADEGIIVTEEQTVKVLETGFAKRGGTIVDVGEIVAEQKKLFVQNYLKSEVIQLLNMNGVNPQQIQNVVPIGASMNDSETSGSIIKTLVAECGLDYANIKKLSSDLRYVNIEMTSKFTEVLFNKLAAEM